MDYVMTRKEELESMYWDFYKEVYNVRPRWVDFTNCTEADIEAMLDSLNVQAQGVWAQREEDEKNAKAKFESLVDMTIAAGAKTRAAALRWIMEGSACSGDWEYLAWNHGLSYGYFKNDVV
jgi:hypothetical protein